MSPPPFHPHQIQADAVPPQPWRNGGGQTRELLAWPNAQQWQLRISRADITRSGPFSAYPGVQRWFVVLSGQGVVLHMPTPDLHTLDDLLLPGHSPLHFDGAQAPGCTLVNGPTQDLNLMARGGQSIVRPVVATQPWLARYALCGLYTACAGTWHSAHQALTLPAHTLLWLDHAPQTLMRFVPEPTPESQAGASLNCAWWWGFTPEHAACPTL